MALFRSKKSFLKAAKAGDAAEVAYTLKPPADCDINVRDVDGATAALIAAREGHLDVLKVLIEKHADLEAADSEGATPLLAAAEENHSDAAKLLIAAGADVNTHNKAYVYPLQAAARHGDLDVVKLLVEKGADVNSVIKSNGRTALHWAVDGEHGPVVEYLLSQGARTDILDRSDHTALGIAKAKPSQRILNLMKAAMQPAAAPAPAPAAAEADSGADGWALMGRNRVAHTVSAPALGRRMTEIFNFEARERVILSENLKTGAETIGTAEKFETLSEDALARAAEELKRLGGEIPQAAPRKSFNL